MKAFVTIVFLLLVEMLLAQEFQGIATYRSSQQVSIKLDSTEFNNAQAQELQEQLRKQFDKQYTLKFNKKESVYNVVEALKLDDPKVSNSRIMIVASSSNDNPLYKNIAEKIYIKEEDLMGKRFLIKDELKLPEWKMESEQKKIGNYTCYKATWTRQEEVTRYDRENGASTETVERVTTAWYTPDIPVGHGPQQFWGLPGLILEIQQDKFSLLCTEIVLNPSEKFQLEIPNKGKEIDQVAFDKIQAEKTKEMMEQFSKGRDKGSIRIRGN